LSKFQKIIFSVFVVLSITAAFFGYRYLRENKQPSVKALTLIPDSCNVMLTFDEYSDFTNTLRNKNLLWQDLKGISVLSALERHLNYFDSLLTGNSDLQDLVSGNKIYFALYPGNKFVVAFNVKELADQEIYKKKLTTLFPSSLYINLKSDVHDGVIGISNSESALNALFSKNNKLVQNKNFAKLDETVDYTGTSIYINQSLLLCHSYSSISIKPESISLNGLSIPDSSSFYGEVSAEPLTSFEFLEQIPLLCNAFEVYSVKRAETVFKNTSQNDWWTDVNDEAMFNAKKQFYSSLESYAIKVLLPSKNHALILGVSDSAKIAEILPYMTDTTSLKSNWLHILKKGNTSFSKSTFNSISTGELMFAILFHDHLVLTSEIDDANIFLAAQVMKSSILENTSFKVYASKNFDIDFHYMRYGLVSSLNKEHLPFQDLITNDDISALKNTSHFSLLSVFKNNFMNSRLHVKYFQEDVSDEPNLLWTLNADTAIGTMPFLFKNHVTKGSELAFQTSDKNLHLINATGKIIWKKKLSEEIKSEIFTVDAFKNKKFQLLFNTENYIHLIDRNGNYVQGYPIKLPARATNKLCVHDYEGKNDLRLFIACSDNKIYNYSIWGIKQEGFKPHVTSGEVILPVKYVKVGPSDYLVTADRKGKIYAFSRKGDGRIDFKNKLVEDASDFELQSGNSLSSTQLIYFDEKNHLIEKISLSDKKEVFKTQESEGSTAYSFGDLDNNSISDMIIATDKKTEVYDLNGSQIFIRDHSSGINPHKTGMYHSGTTTNISIFDQTNSTVTLENIEQKTSKNYSASQSPFICDLYNDGKIYIIIPEGKKLKCYKL
jgi:outer membrane protein assembly factor BamB